MYNTWSTFTLNRYSSYLIYENPADLRSTLGFCDLAGFGSKPLQRSMGAKQANVPGTGVI